MDQLILSGGNSAELKLAENVLIPQKIRNLILEQAMRAHVGHIGSALSVVEILAAVFSSHGFKSNDSLNQQSRSVGNLITSTGYDRFILSKGHAALTYYVILFLLGRLSADQLNSYCGNGSELGVHPEKSLAGVDFSSGSLGMGLSMGVGAALAMKLKAHTANRVRVVLSDAELNEGSTWEAVMFAAHAKVSNLDVIVDMNGQQAMGFTHDILEMENQIERWEAFGFEVRECDGHDLNALKINLQNMAQSNGKPQVLFAKTVSGKGLSFMEKKIDWHYQPMSEKEFVLAQEELSEPIKPRKKKLTR